MKRNWYWLIPVVVAFIVGYFLRGIGQAGLPDETVTGYDVFRDLLSILLALLVGAGALLYLVIRREVGKKVTEDVEKRFFRLEGELFIHEGVMYFLHDMYEWAIKCTKTALRLKKYLRTHHVIVAKSNLAYYYGARHKHEEHWEDKEEAIKLAKSGYDKYDPLVEEFNRPHWVDNYVFVRASFARTDKEKAEVRQLIDRLLPRLDLQTIKHELFRHRDSLGI